jgi:hypothetical protein
MKFQLKKWLAPLLAGWFRINLDGMKPGEKPTQEASQGKPDETLEE